ncbi:MAG: 50S ribosomal protein L22 [Verrucomicrobia bacterium]|jgi:large subunit ribosomal protein L22|nr:50S ribosomal protein L22 [Verrucomicrobiota bacterium]MBO4795894.1 50S ribosomal protein L22 [Verrucomicrobiota bacterium]MBQ7589671.1 50S ribosomal protein L22 [Verrucomicrobiota bacterium]MBR5606191.1 50S ribosomal protein L22 [Verrucomicrobiota bacterium]MBR5691610.1 50S ribosomal protein L22 [Verrucomicrobiota bacterium]
MKVLSVTKNIRMSPQKMREVTRQIHGMKAIDAQAALAYVPRKSARAVLNTLKSAIANAVNNFGLDEGSLWIVESVAGAARTYKRFTPKARGSAGHILKRGCHVRIVLSDISTEN